MILVISLCHLVALFAIFAKSDYRFVMSVRPHGTIRLPLDGFSCNFNAWIFFFTKKFVRKIHVSLKSDKSNDQFAWRPSHIVTESRWILLRIKNISDKICSENQNTHIWCSNPPTQPIPPPENRVFYDIMLKKMVESDRPQIIIGACAFHAAYLRLQTHTQNM